MLIESAYVTFWIIVLVYRSLHFSLYYRKVFKTPLLIRTFLYLTRVSIKSKMLIMDRFLNESLKEITAFAFSLSECLFL